MCILNTSIEINHNIIINEFENIAWTQKSKRLYYLIVNDLTRETVQIKKISLTYNFVSIMLECAKTYGTN